MTGHRPPVESSRDVHKRFKEGGDPRVPCLALFNHSSYLHPYSAQN